MELASWDPCVLTASWAGVGSSGLAGLDRGLGQGFPSMVLLVPVLCRFLFQSLASLKYSILVPDEILGDCTTPEQGHCALCVSPTILKLWMSYPVSHSAWTGKVDLESTSSSHLRMPALRPPSAEDIFMGAALGESSSMHWSRFQALQSVPGLNCLWQWYGPSYSTSLSLFPGLWSGDKNSARRIGQEPSVSGG